MRLQWCRFMCRCKELQKVGSLEDLKEYLEAKAADERKAQAFLKDIEDPRGRSSEGERSSRYTHLAEEPLYLHMLCWLWAGTGG